MISEDALEEIKKIAKIGNLNKGVRKKLKLRNGS